MRTLRSWLVIAIGSLFASAALAQQAPAGAPTGTTGLCKDGSYWSGASKRGACSGHKGVKEWYGGSSGSSAAAPAASSSSSAPAASNATAAPATPAASPAAAPKAPAPGAAVAPGGGAGQVWVNHKSKVYHCSGDRWYGKTKDGEYLSEADASAKGYRPDHGKACK